jgi:hypothetical protein
LPCVVPHTHTCTWSRKNGQQQWPWCEALQGVAVFFTLLSINNFLIRAKELLKNLILLLTMRWKRLM